MPHERLALYTVVYPGVEPYLAEWYTSVEAQTDRGFDLWISSDGLAPSSAEACVGRRIEAQWLPAATNATPAGLRAAALAHLAAAYSGIVLVDSDDVLLPSRIAAARAGLGSADVAGCALRIADAGARPLGPVLGPPPDVVDWDAFLARHNVFGLSNTAYRAEVLRRCLPLPEAAVLIDWLLVLRARGLGAVLAFDGVPRMVYRQHPANVARVLPPFTPAYVCRATALVLAHYGHVLADPPPVASARREPVHRARDTVRAFQAAVVAAPERLAVYVDALNRLEPRFVWWWCVANPLLEELWSN